MINLIQWIEPQQQDSVSLLIDTESIHDWFESKTLNLLLKSLKKKKFQQEKRIVGNRSIGF